MLTDSANESLQTLGQVPLVLRAELDRKTIPFRELMDLNIDSIVALSRPAGENVDLYAGEVYVGSGEILVNDSMFAVRLADFGEGRTAPAGGTTEDGTGNQS